MVKINRLTYFIVLRILEAVILFYLKYLNAYTVKNFTGLIKIFIPVTLLVLIANFSKYKRLEKYKPPLDVSFGLLLTVLLVLESFLMYGAPKGYLDFVTARWIIGGIEVVLGICLGFIKKIDLL